jgi:antitoxin HigA-1
MLPGQQGNAPCNDIGYTPGLEIQGFPDKRLERFVSTGATAEIQAKRVEVNMRMHNPPHPGEVLKTLCLEPLNLTVTDAARSPGVSRKTLSAILKGRAGISPQMAVRLSIAFDTSAESWPSQQLQYDVWHVEKSRKRLRVRKLTAA